MKTDWKKIVLGFLLLPLAFILFLVDRVILLPLVWKDAPNIKVYFEQMHNITLAIYRVGAVFIVLTLYYLIKWIF